MLLTLTRRILVIPYIVFIIVGIVWLSGFTLTNPTWRRYSSDSASQRTSSTGSLVWREAEIILENDLGIPFNDTADTRQCICSPDNGNILPGRCNVCLMPPVRVRQNYSLPDFVTVDLIADSKYVTTFSIDAQIEDFITAAKETNREVWIYVRTNTGFTSTTDNRIEATGGDIVRYFVVDGYHDPFDSIAKILLIVGGSGIVLILGLEAWRWLHSQSPDNPDEGADAIDEVDDAVDVVDETENYMRRVERLSRKEIDKRNDSDRKR
jgi:hypothetical protein